VKVVYFTHSLRSCWNHGNAHFLRGVLRELAVRGNDVRAWEPDGAWSVQNLLRDGGPAGLEAWRRLYPELQASVYGPGFDPADACDGADLVIMHEWNEPELVAAVGRLRARGAAFTLLFHDTHHRAVTDPGAIGAFDLTGYDGVLAFGEALAEVYRGWGWGRRAFVWHEAADIRLFRPPAVESPREGLIWIGNWGDDERSAELEQFLLAPARAAGLSLDVHGVRYPPSALERLAAYGATYRGWTPNTGAQDLFARRLATVHVPRGAYARDLPGIPTIRMFEALACGIPLASAPWRDREGLFRVGEDFLMAATPAAMTNDLRALREDPGLRAELAANGLQTIRGRHTCAHRVDELMRIVAGLRGESPSSSAPAEAML
jgi:spore maturation protein CgeB